jgi:inosine-uridine nucleoside N-ribohydrolase
MSSLRLHIDTDPGLDDLLALALALACPEAEIVSATTVAGNASIDAVTENAQRFFALAGHELPLGRGAAAPLSLDPVNAELYHGEDGRRGISIPAIDRRPLRSAGEVLRASLGAGAVDCVLALGPLTNIALLIQQEPQLFDGVEIVWMGGCLGEGNATPLAEFNCWADPAAVAVVLGSDLEVRIVGLEVTRCVQLTATELPPRPFGTSEMGRLCEAVISAQMDAEEPLAGERRATLHDPCALLAALDLDLFRYEPKQLSVVVQDGRERGRLREETPDPNARGVRYAVEVHTPRIQQVFVERLAAYCGAEGS